MEKGQRKPIDRDARKTFGANLALVVSRECKGKSEEERARHLRIGIRSLRRILSGEQGVSLDTAARMARRLNTPLWQLFFPGLDPSNPPVFAISEEERAFYRKMQEKAKEAIREGAH